MFSHITIFCVGVKSKYFSTIWRCSEMFLSTTGRAASHSNKWDRKLRNCRCSIKPMQFGLHATCTRICFHSRNWHIPTCLKRSTTELAQAISAYIHFRPQWLQSKATLSNLDSCWLARLPHHSLTQANSAFHPSGVGKWVPASAGKAKAGMVHSVSGEISWERVPYLSALKVWSWQGAIQIHIYLYLTLSYW